ncbi:MAG: lysylphosphatidylglycerol synthase transmembrane domain-containing protein [Lachnospiraceae bacterium]
MNREKWIKLLKNGAFFCILFVVTFYLLFRDKNMGSILQLASKVNPYFLILAIACMGTFVACEAMNIRRTLNLYQYESTFFTAIRYAFVGFFFSSITPSASGGQPMQVYYMHKDGIEISHSVLALMIEFASFQFVTISAGIIGFFSNIDFFTQQMSGLTYVLILGLSLNCLVLAALVLAIFSKKIPGMVIHGVTCMIKKMGYKKWEQFQKKAEEQILLYQQGAQTLKKNKGKVIQIILTTCVQILAYHSIPYLIYLSFGFQEHSFGIFFAAQAVLYVTVSAIPLPGAVGAGESGFLLLFASLFPLGFVDSAMLLSRGISFYLFLVMSGLFVGIRAKAIHAKTPSLKITGE